ncbi:MAG: hypothetical protein MJ177_03605 [Clostridia bacterium]|nr:hypothetical protein [Clostridia bacterium]
MIKGVNRKVVEVNDTGSEYFEKIIFFVRPEYASVSEGKIRERAGLIANSGTLPPPTRQNRNIIKKVLICCLCAALGAAAAAIICSL